MKRIIGILGVMVALLVAACSSKGEQKEVLFPSDVVRSAEKALQEKVDYLGIPAPVFGDNLSDNELAAMKWIYAYSYAPDIIDQTPEFHLENIRIVLKAREELPWGKEVPLEQWRAFVLPLRINNEILDNFRVAYYEELRDLVKDMTMEQAVLELNHWTHQHITYAPSDGRTSSPLATLRNALGRCGEQSTFFAAVLRTVGIPARQVYTPRWAHTDDNHAWVEAWVDGTWHYMGASEPAPVLDNAWFDAPVMRAMLLHTRAFGPYSGEEEWLGEDKCMTELNVSENYIPTAPAMVKVMGKDGKPAEGVKVTFRIYNYSDLYPAVTRTTNRLGEASVKLGYGDIVVVASRNPEEMAMGLLSNKEGGGTIELTLDTWENIPAEQHLRITPPVERIPDKGITEEMEAANNARMTENNAIRNAYTETFPTEESAKELADELKLSGDARNKLITLYPNTRGYHKEITDFLRAATNHDKATEAVLLLASLMEKDLHDVDIQVLNDALERNLSPEQWKDADLICPRVMLEHLYPVEDQLSAAVKELADTIQWEQRSIAERAKAIATTVEGFKIDELYNPNRIVMSPASVWTYKMGDTRSLTVLVVRLLRTAGISAKYDTANGVIVYKDEQGKTQILPFLQKNEKEVVSADCALRLSYKSEGYLKTPKYESNFSVGYVDNDGQLTTYGFDWQTPYNEVSGASLLYDKNYIITGTRLADGTVLLGFRKQTCGEISPLIFDRDEMAVSVIGNLNAEALYYDLATQAEKSIISTTGRGYYVLVIGRAHHEPTDHILRDMQALVNKEGKLPLPTIVLANAPTPELQALLPQATWGKDTQGIEQTIMTGNELGSRIDKPLVVIADTFNRVVFMSQGYTIGIGERLAQVVAEI
ncbi:transglutaminase-like domain-containing protein [Porphyromonas levii]|uniref:transglutaminase-like domain-containing protein n=1 Tax=Porphyromonas levii TaxID=28114 RepID=UPI0003A85E97|nr:transglutaminase-like domain-containing protein [Porphyromonas levii]